MPYKDREKANEYERNRYNRRKKNPEWMNRLRVRRRKNSKAFFKRAMNDPIKKEALYKKIRVYQRKWIHLPHVKTKRQQYCFMIMRDGKYAIDTGKKAEEEVKKIKAKIREDKSELSSP